MRLAVGNAGWVKIEEDDLTAFVRFELHNERLDPVDLLLFPKDRRLGANDLRDFPIGRVVSWVAEPQIRDSLVKRLGEQGPHIRGLAEDFATTRYAPDREPPKVRKPKQAAKHPNAFYEQVAARYLWWARQGEGPTQKIAAEVGDKKPYRVQRWIKRCRELGLLDRAPGRGRRG